MNNQIQVNNIEMYEINYGLSVYFAIDFMGETRRVAFCTTCDKSEEDIKRIVMDKARQKAIEIREELDFKNTERNLNNYFKDSHFLLVEN